LLNTNGYLTPEALALATHLFEIFVVDLKFGCDGCAEKIAGTPAYMETLERNLRLLQDGGSSRQETAGVVFQPVTLWVRHLLMPGHWACCTQPVLKWIAEHLPAAHINVMSAFHPFGLPDNDDWPSLQEEEKASAKRLLLEMGHPQAYFDGRRCHRA
jgi:putative pyruvate formate lyase activating enzyme